MPGVGRSALTAYPKHEPPQVTALTSASWPVTCGSGPVPSLDLGANAVLTSHLVIRASSEYSKWEVPNSRFPILNSRIQNGERLENSLV